MIMLTVGQLLAGYWLGAILKKFALLLPSHRKAPKRRSPLPLAEMSTAILFLLVFSIHGTTLEAVWGLLFTCFLVTVSVCDVAYKLIPNIVVIPSLAVFALLRLYLPWPAYADHLWGMVAGFTLFFLLALLSRGGVGGGDVKLYAAVGLFLGISPLMVAIQVSAVTGALFGLGLAWKKKSVRNLEIPFAPFISFGAMVAYLA